MKALWNYISLYREGSFGIHNPGFTKKVIGATSAEVIQTVRTFGKLG